MEVNIIFWIAAAILAGYTFSGFSKGLIRTVFSTFAFIAAMIIASQASPYVSKQLQQTPLYDQLSTAIESQMFGSGTEDTSDIGADVSNVNVQTMLINQLELPEALKEVIIENNNSQIYQALGVTTFYNYLSGYLACMILNAISYLIVYAVVIIILKIAEHALNLLSHLPVLHSVNKIGGLLFGLINGFVVLWIICIVITVFSSTEAGAYIFAQINKNTFLKLIYNNNYLLNYISSLKNLWM